MRKRLSLSKAEYFRSADPPSFRYPHSARSREFVAIIREPTILNFDSSPSRVGVFCASVLLHFTDPLRALYAIRGVTREQAIICTAIDPALHVRGQARALFRGTATGQAFWLPTMACLEQMALASGFRRVERVSTFRLRSRDGNFDTPHGTVRAFV